jgi:hypothetical protein
MTMDWPSPTMSAHVHAVIISKIGEINQGLRPTPLSAAFQIGLIQLISSYKGNLPDEEEVTANLYSHLSFACTWLSEEFTKIPSPGFDWASYKKCGKTMRTEGGSGADFSILVRFSDGSARAAVFQAKNSDDGQSLNVHRISPLRIKEDKVILPEPQILRLTDYGISQAAQGSTIDDLGWIHLCGYGPRSFFCVPLNSVGDTVIAYRRSQVSVEPRLKTYYKTLGKKTAISGIMKNEAAREWKAHNDVTVSRNAFTIELVHLLSIGASTPLDQPCPGWLLLEDAAAADRFVSSASGITQVIDFNAGHSPEMSNDADLDADGQAFTREVVQAANAQLETYTFAHDNPTQTPPYGNALKMKKMGNTPYG